MSTSAKFELFINPAGFVEEKFYGVQTPSSVLEGMNCLIKEARKLAASGRQTLILVDITEVPKLNTSAAMKQVHKDIVQAMREETYDRIAVYGDLATQVLVNTLTLIAGKRRKIRVFSDRVDALRWLRT